jgi:hypothetical protein
MSKPGYQLVVGICSVFKACNSGAEYSKGIMPEDKAAALIGSMRKCKGLLCRHGHFKGIKELFT